MATILNFFFTALFLALIGQGYCQCSVANMIISQTKTGKTVGSKPEWRVTIRNECECTQWELIISCDGFQTAEAVDTALMSKFGRDCLINGGLPLYSFSTVSFNYAWDTSFPFKALSSQPRCP